MDMESAFFVNSAHLCHEFFDENGLLLLLLYHIFEKSKEFFEILCKIINKNQIWIYKSGGSAV